MCTGCANVCILSRTFYAEMKAANGGGCVQSTQQQTKQTMTLTTKTAKRFQKKLKESVPGFLQIFRSEIQPFSSTFSVDNENLFFF